MQAPAAASGRPARASLKRTASSLRATAAAAPAPPAPAQAAAAAPPRTFRSAKRPAAARLDVSTLAPAVQQILRASAPSPTRSPAPERARAEQEAAPRRKKARVAPAPRAVRAELAHLAEQFVEVDDEPLVEEEQAPPPRSARKPFSTPLAARGSGGRAAAPASSARRPLATPTLEAAVQMYPGFEDTYASYCASFRLAPGVASPLSKPEFLRLAAGRDGFLTRGEKPAFNAGAMLGDE